MVLTFLANIFVSIFAGMLIGLERQWKKKLAGIRTTTLVCFGACMFVTLSTLFETDGSPSRIAAQVVSGVGFLAGGVILRDGSSVSGINTAATLWCSAAIGAIIGAGFPLYGIMSAVILMILNIGLRFFAEQVDVLSLNRYSKDVKHYYLSVVCGASEEIKVRTTIFHHLNELYLNFNQIICGEEENGKVTILIDLEIYERERAVDLKLAQLTSTLLQEPSILEVQRINSTMVD